MSLPPKIKKIFKKLEQLITKYDYLLIFFVTFFIYILTTFPTVQTEDSGELITSAIGLDIAHPPGYPLYVLLGKIFSLIIPFGNPAWRINIMSGFFAAAAAALLYLFLKKLTKNDLLSMAGSLAFAFTDIVWSQSNRAEVYTLNLFFLALIIYLLYRWHETQKNRWLYFTALSYGLSIANHHLMLLAAPAIITFVLVRNWRVILNPKLIIFSILLFLAGLSVYLYLPIRTYLAPYDNPAFIDHNGLYTWDKFIAFVNRSIYGGTVNIATPQATQEAAANHFWPIWLINLKDFIFNYGQRFIDNNAKGLLTLFKTLAEQYFYIPLFLILPGLYSLFKKDWRWALFLVLLFFFYSSVMIIFVSVEPHSDNFGSLPFFIPALFALIIFTISGYQWLIETAPWKKAPLIFGLAFFIVPTLGITLNFSKNNESGNYIAYDFNKNLLESIPPNGYLLSTGRDNMTFPLYYLRKIEGIRTDVNLEIYYTDQSKWPVNEDFLKNKLAETGQKTIFVDLAPADYDKIDVKPYNYVFRYGSDQNLPPETPNNFGMRGIRKQGLDQTDLHLVTLHYLKLGLLAENDPQKMLGYFQIILDNFAQNNWLINFIGNYDRNHKHFDQAIQAYQLINNSGAADQVKNIQAGNLDGGTFTYQSGMF